MTRAFMPSHARSLPDRPLPERFLPDRPLADRFLAAPSTRISPRLRSLVLALSLALLLPLAQPAPASAANAGEVAGLVNAARAAAGLPALAVAGDLSAIAQQQAQRMASQGKLFHSSNLGGVVTNWKRIGENVGYGADAGSIQAAFMASAPHRANLLDGGFTQIGVGAASGGGSLWVVHVFRLPAGAAAPPPPPPPVAVPAAKAPPVAVPAPKTPPTPVAPTASAPAPTTEAPAPPAPQTGCRRGAATRAPGAPSTHDRARRPGAGVTAARAGERHPDARLGAAALSRPPDQADRPAHHGGRVRTSGSVE